VPELPEVETIVRQLAPRVEGRSLAEVEVLDPRWPRPLAPAELERALRGRTVSGLSRRGKYLVWEAGELFLLVHLRMTGTLLYDPPLPAPYARAHFAFDDGHVLVFSDPRRFGTGWLLAGQPELDAYLGARLGVEPFSEDFTGEHLHALARGSRAPVKAFLLDQKRIAGLGNIYVSEALHRARKAAKRYRYAAELSAPVSSAAVQRAPR